MLKLANHADEDRFSVESAPAQLSNLNGLRDRGTYGNKAALGQRRRGKSIMARELIGSLKMLFAVWALSLMQRLWPKSDLDTHTLIAALAARMAVADSSAGDSVRGYD